MGGWRVHHSYWIKNLTKYKGDVSIVTNTYVI